MGGNVARPSTDSVIQDYRRRIDEIDRGIVEALHRRVELVKELKAYKETQGLDFLDAAREERVLAQWSGEGGPASPEGLREMGRTILEWTKREVARGGSPASE